MSDPQLAAASRLFSSALVRELGRRGRSVLFARLAAESGLASYCEQHWVVGTLLDHAFRILQKQYRHEYVYKAALAHKTLLGVHNLATATMLTEFRVGNCKADAVVLNGTGTVYEIKSDRDNLDRLGSQATTYLQAFAEVYVITDESRMGMVPPLVPDDVGLLKLTRRGTLSPVRKAVKNPRRIVPEVVFGSLQAHEAGLVLRQLGIRPPDVPNTLRHCTQRAIFIRQDPADLHDAVIRVLKETRSQRRLAALISHVPYSLKPAVLMTRLRSSDHERLRNAVATPLAEALAWA